MSGALVNKLNSNFSKIFDLIDTKRRVKLDQNTKYTVVRTWLKDGESQKKKKWLLVVDNANQETIKHIKEMLPRNNSNSKIPLTTHTKQVAQSLAMAFEEQHLCIALHSPGTDNAVTLFLSAAGIERKKSDTEKLQEAKNIVKAVEYLPLAMNQAASFTKETKHEINETLDIYMNKQVK